MQTTSARFNGLDHLRAIAILLVLMYHYRAFMHPDWIDTYGRFGWTGVDLFFVLSGFLISNQLFQEIKNRGNFSLKSFFTKRFFRIIPPYFFTLLLYFCFPFFRERESLSPLWKFLIFHSELQLRRHQQRNFFARLVFVYRGTILSDSTFFITIIHQIKNIEISKIYNLHHYNKMLGLPRLWQ